MREFLLGLALAGPLAASARSSQDLQVGHPSSGTVLATDPKLLQDGPTRRLKLVSKAGGKATISVNSFDFDAFVRVESEAGDVIAEADGGGIETNARLVVTLARDQTYQVLVAAKGGGSGWFWVDCRAGELPPLSREAVQIAAIAYHGGAASTELAKGEKAAAATHLERKGSILLEQRKAGEASLAFESARGLWEQLKDVPRAIRATLDLGRAASAGKDWKLADERFDEALAAYRALSDPSGESRTLSAKAGSRAAAGESAAAKTLYEEALAVAEKSADAESAAVALAGIADLSRTPADAEQERETAEKLADLWRAGGDLEKALEARLKAVAIAREAQDAAAEGEALTDLGQDWLQGREWTRARECFEAALVIAKGRSDDAARADALDGLGQVWFRLQDYAKALKLHEEQLAAAGSDAGRAGRATLRIGMCSLAMRDYGRARERLESEVQRNRAAGDAAREAEALEFLSFVEQQTGNPEEARAKQVRAAELRQDTDGPWIAFRRAQDRFGAGEIAAAQEVFERCLEQSKQNPRLRIEALLWLGLCHRSGGRYADSIRCFSEMVDIARRLNRRVDEAEGLEHLAGEYLSVGASDKALELYEEALAIASETGNAPVQAQSQNGVANAWLELRQHEKARTSYGEVAALGKQLGFPIVELVALNNRGVAYWEEGLYEEARPLLEEAVKSATEMKAPAHLAEFQGNLARVLRKLGEPERAKELGEASLEGVSEPRLSLIALEALAPIAIADADLARAESLLARADAVLEEIRVEAQAAPGDIGADPWMLSPRFDRFRQDLVRQTELDGGLGGADRAKLLERGFREADRARARHLASGIVGHRRGARSKDTTSLRAEWKEALAQIAEQQKELSRSIRESRPSAEVDALHQEVIRRRTRADDLGDALRAVAPGEAALDLPEGVEPQAVRATGALAGSALIEYAEGDEDLYAYVLTERGLTLLELGKRKAVDAQVERYVALLGARKGLAAPGEIAEAGRELFDLLLASALAAAGPDAKRLLVVPTPSLAVLPFDALVVEAKSGPQSFEDVDFVIDRFEVDYCPSASILVLLASAGPRKSGGKVLVLADPIYPSEAQAAEAAAPASATPAFLAGTRGVLPEGREFQRLVKTREEALTIAALLIDDKEEAAQARLTRLQRSRGGSLRANMIDLCLGADASAAQLAGDLRPYTFIHLAAHGWVDGQNTQRTGIALAWSGDGEYAGFFTLADAIGLDLDSDLVVLSACETARGKIREGEGVESMACAFLSAGSRGVIASLWQVEDLAAAETMKSLYAGILAGKKPAAALHEAKLAIRHGSISRGLAQKEGDTGRRDKGNPCDWAPFIHIGLPR